jgi:hypothetical protein
VPAALQALEDQGAGSRDHDREPPEHVHQVTTVADAVEATAAAEPFEPAEPVEPVEPVAGAPVVTM